MNSTSLAVTGWHLWWLKKHGKERIPRQAPLVPEPLIVMLASSFLPRALSALHDAGVRLHGDDRVRAAVPGLPVEVATEADWETEYLALELAVRVVDSVEEAIEHINAHGSGHSEAILTRDTASARAFELGVDAALVAAERVQERRLHGVLGFLAVAELVQAVRIDLSRVALVEVARGVRFRSGSPRCYLTCATYGRNCDQKMLSLESGELPQAPRLRRAPSAHGARLSGSALGGSDSARPDRAAQRSA